MSLTVWAPDGVPEVVEGADLAGLLLDALAAAGRPLADGDIVCVTSKVVSKAEGRLRSGDRAEALAGETVRVVARRGPTVIVRNRLGLTMAAAGIDASNVEAGHYLLLPVDPDASARALRSRLSELVALNVGVVVTDTAGRAWREGQTDLGIGCAGVAPLVSFAGESDAYGNPLAVTAPAVIDEIAGAAELAQGKLGARPFAVVRGLAALVAPAGEHGPGASTLVRAEGGDLFGYGAREAVVRALAGAEDDRLPFGAPASADDLADAVRLVAPEAEVAVVDERALEATGADLSILRTLAFAHGWALASDGRSGDPVRLRSTSP